MDDEATAASLHTTVAPQEPILNKAKLLVSEGQSSTSTTWRDLSERTHLSASRVSPNEASMMCLGALAELSVDTVVISVTSCSHGCIRGLLECDLPEPQEVEFRLLQVKPGYTIVGDVSLGPEIFEKVCWKLTMVNYMHEADPSWIAKGDILFLEGPRWATQRLRARIRRYEPELPKAVDRIELMLPSAQLDAATAAAVAAADAIGLPPSSALADLPVHAPWSSDSSARVSATRRPVVPRLDLAGMPREGPEGCARTLNMLPADAGCKAAGCQLGAGSGPCQMM